jgi:hypothetical protein
MDSDLEKQELSQATATATASLVPAPPTKIEPLLALELRLRWLEAFILGVKQDLGRASLKHGETVSRLAETVQRKLNKAVQGNEGLTKFMDQCMFSFPFPFRSGLSTHVQVYCFFSI